MALYETGYKNKLLEPFAKLRIICESKGHF